MNTQTWVALPIPKARKNNEVNITFKGKAKDMVRDGMKAKGMNIDQLTQRLALIGIEMSSGGVTNKISRGGFSSSFLLQCLAAMDFEIKMK